MKGEYSQIFVCVILICLRITECTITQSLEGFIELLNPYDEVVKLNKRIDFSTPFSVNSNLLDESAISSNPLNPIQCLTSIVSFASDSISDSGVSITTKSSYITNEFFYLTYLTHNSPTRLTRLQIKWMCFLSEDVQAFPFNTSIDGTDSENRISLHGGNLSDIQLSNSTTAHTYIISGFTSKSSSFDLGLLFSQEDDSQFVLVKIEGGNASNLSSVSGVLLVSRTDSCTRMTINRSKSVKATEVIEGSFTPFKSSLFAMFTGLHHLYLRTNVDSAFSIDTTPIDVTYKTGTAKVSINANANENTVIHVTSLICSVEAITLTESTEQMAIGIGIVITGFALFLLTTRVYMKKKLAHHKLRNEHDHECETDH